MKIMYKLFSVFIVAGSLVLGHLGTAGSVHASITEQGIDQKEVITKLCTSVAKLMIMTHDVLALNESMGFDVDYKAALTNYLNADKALTEKITNFGIEDFLKQDKFYFPKKPLTGYTRNFQLNVTLKNRILSSIQMIFRQKCQSSELPRIEEFLKTYRHEISVGTEPVGSTDETQKECCNFLILRLRDELQKGK